MERENCFDKEYGEDIKKLGMNRKGQPESSLWNQVYKLNGLIYRELDICKDEGINPKWSRCYHKLLEVGEKRFGKYGYVFAGRMFIRKDKLL